jgi:hypothetical protein
MPRAWCRTWTAEDADEPADEPVRLLHALRAAGCHVFIEDGQLFCSPPARHIDWDADPEEAIEEFYWELKELVSAERLSVH